MSYVSIDIKLTFTNTETTEVLAARIEKSLIDFVSEKDRTEAEIEAHVLSFLTASVISVSVVPASKENGHTSFDIEEALSDIRRGGRKFAKPFRP